MGNGPSLNKMDLSFLPFEKNVFAANKIYLGFEKFNFLPTYHTAINGLVLQQSAKEILEMDVPYRFVPLGKGFPLHYGIHFLIKDMTSTDFHKTGVTFHEGWTVTYANMQLAYVFGCKTVYLIGVDHHFEQVGKPNSKQILEGEDPNHFSPNYFKDQEWHLADLKQSEKYYNVAKKVYEEDGRIIIDATLNGKCQVFPKEDYRKVFLGE